MFTTITQKSKIKNYFTLLELICVLAISVLVVGVVVGRVGKTPTFISLKNTALKIQRVLSEASNQALVNGVKVTIKYDNRKFYPTAKDNSKAFSTASDKYLKYTLPESVEIDFPYENEDENILFTFYPDGSASSPEIKLNQKTHSITLKTSKLTGVTTIASE